MRLFLAKWLLKVNTVEGANLLTEYILDNLKALPMRDVIRIEGNQLFINGMLVPKDEEIKLRLNAESALRNKALSLIQEQISYAAIVTGVHKAENPAQMFFARAALWWGQEEKKLLEMLAERSSDEET